jgi:hypothetical protein
MKPRTPFRVALVMTTAVAFSQSPPEPSTKFAGHVIGETVQQWLATNHMDIPEICGPHKRSDKRMDFKAACAVLSGAQAGRSEKFTTIQSARPDCRIDSAGILRGCDTYDSGVDWYFENSKVANATKTESLNHSTAEEQIGFLSALYGRPSKMDTIHHQNAMGGTWDTVEVSWDMPDGALMFGIEMVYFSDTGPLRTFVVFAESRESAAQAEKVKRDKPNPYK